MSGFDLRAQDWVRTLESEPYRFDFYHLMRRVDAGNAGLPQMGATLRPQHDPLRLGQDAEMDFAPANVTSFRMTGSVPRLGVRFMGLFGPNGPLPLHLTEYARDRRQHHGDSTLTRFADIFHHRMLSLFYRSWAQAQPTVDFDRPAQARFPVRIAALAGILSYRSGGSQSSDSRAPAMAGKPGISGDSLPFVAKVYQSGVLSRNVRNAEGLLTALRQYFGWPVTLSPYTGHWLILRDADRTRLGGAGLGARVGQGAVAGSKVWDRQYRFTLMVGPLRWAQFIDLLPGVEAHRGGLQGFVPHGLSLLRLRDWVRLTIGLDLTWDMRLVLSAGDVPRARLGLHNQLGWTSWLLPARGSDRDRNDLLIDPERLLAAKARREQVAARRRAALQAESNASSQH